MGKSLVSAVRLHELSPIVSSSATANAQRQRPNQPQKQQQPRLPNRVATNLQSQSQPQKLKLKMEETSPLAHVVADCTHRWFQDTLKEAKVGDPAMQLMVAQMYYSGYGVPTDPQKGHAWISKALRSRNSVWKSSDKHIGYRTSDSDSYVLENRAKFSP